MTEFDVNTRYGVTAYVIGAGAVARAAKVLGVSESVRVMVVADAEVWRLHGRSVQVGLSAGGAQLGVHVVPGGEGGKSLGELERIYEACANLELSRDGLMVAFGGGVVGDLAGFAAATWMRGVRYGIMPTTLLACIDASIGGKTAINTAAGKNLAGAFHQPCAVVMDLSWLHTLPPAQWRAGMAESVKHALIAGEEFLAWHECHPLESVKSDDGLLTELIVRNVRIKSDIVDRDEREVTGVRAQLNLGHTIGHAIEHASGYTMSHGACVGLGLVAACRLSERVAGLDRAVTERVVHLLSRLGLPTRLTDPPAVQDVMTALAHDKKALAGGHRFVVLDRIGSVWLMERVDMHVIQEAYESLTR